MTWVTQHDDCPMCRGDITQTKTVPDDDEDSDYEEEPEYNVTISGDVRQDEIYDIMDRVDEFIDLDKEPEFKWKDSTNGSSYLVIKKNKYFIDLKFDLYKVDGNIYTITVDVNKRSRVKYDKKNVPNIKLNKHLQKNRMSRHLFR
jgi:hypothetical protein